MLCVGALCCSVEHQTGCCKVQVLRLLCIEGLYEGFCIEGLYEGSGRMQCVMAASRCVRPQQQDPAIQW